MIFSRPEKKFLRTIFPSEDDNIARKIDRKLTRRSKENFTLSNISNSLFVTLCTGLLPFLFRCCVIKRRAKTAGKTRNTTDFQAHSNPLEDISNHHDVTSHHCFALFQKWKSSGLIKERDREGGEKPCLPQDHFLTFLSSLSVFKFEMAEGHWLMIKAFGEKPGGRKGGYCHIYGL